MNAINIKEIKLIIWDLDDTFWQGTISEEKIVPVERNILLIRNLTDCGIINSICSKNDFEPTADKLRELGVWDFFVFPSINWENKAQRIKNQIETMGLRPVNVLFIDDNSFNLQEVRHFLPEIMTAPPEIIDDLVEQTATLEKLDLKHKRLKQYKLLEEKAEEEKKFDSNEDFLFASNIKVELHSDCERELARLHEIILRTNQLNFTKLRISEEELKIITSNPEYRCGYVTVSDKFGDYGIVGFFALKNNRLEHFLFSCRTMGQGIEQYVYAVLDYPEIQLVGEVRSKLKKDFLPKWINQTQDTRHKTQDTRHKTQDTRHKTQDTRHIGDANNVKILLKGPCDLAMSQTYIKGSENFTTEYTYVNENQENIIEGYNHSVHILGLKQYDEKAKQLIEDECIFVNKNMLNGTFFTEKYDVIFLSTLIESNYGIYRRKETDIDVAFGGHLYPLTDPEMRQKYIDGTIYNGNNHFTLEYLQKFSENWEFVGKTTPESYVERLQKMLDFLSKNTVLCLILGAEFPNTKPENAYKEHIALNNAAKELAKTEKRLKYIEISKIAKIEKDFTDTINHFPTRIYYEIAQKMIEIINENTAQNFANYSKSILFFDNILSGIKFLTKKIVNVNNPLYKMLKNSYLTLRRKKKTL